MSQEFRNPSPFSTFPVVPIKRLTTQLNHIVMLYMKFIWLILYFSLFRLGLTLKANALLRNEPEYLRTTNHHQKSPREGRPEVDL